MRYAIRLGLMALLGALANVTPASACGGLFCQNIPVNQAGEQILFNKEGEFVTAMVRILYQGNAEDFSWVVPVPTIPKLSTGSDMFFDELDNSTQPFFRLNRSGDGACPIFDFLDAGSAESGSAGSPSTADSGGVNIVQELSVGPFEIKILSSNNPDELATWLVDNNYDLSSRGRELIAPYVNEGMKFVAAKLRSGEPTGSIQPLIMKYKSDKPMVPIKLTAVAALEDMGVLVWLVSDARAVPDNYLHVEPNYTKLNWFTGPRNAYGSYQSLITDAMNEAGGQGFATDYAQVIDSSLTEFMTSADVLDAELARLDALSSDMDFLATLYDTRFNEATQLIYSRYLPLPQGQDESIYANALALMNVYTNEELAKARTDIRQAIVDVDIEPLRASTALLTEGRYLTRLYTTLSADEMTLDPSFEFNPNMEPQSRMREAMLVENCINNETVWSLTLGEGTGRNGETVMNGRSGTPTTIPQAATLQSSVRSAAKTSGDAMPEIRVSNQFEKLNLNADGELATDVSVVDSGSSSFLGSASYWWIYFSVFLIALRRSQFRS